MAVPRDAAGKNAGGVYAAADDRRAYAVSEQKNGGDGPVAHAHRAVDHLGQEARQGHDAEGFDIELARKAPEEIGDPAEGYERQQAVSQYHEEEREETPLDHLLPFAVTRAGR